MSNIPKLRFREFSGEWEEKKLGDISVFYNSKRIPLTESDRDKGDYPYYGASGIIDYVQDYIFNGEYILLGEDGANIIMRNSRLVFLATGKFWVNNHAHIFQALESNAFLCEALERLNYSQYNTGTAQPKLNSEVVKKIKLNMPKKQEQEKIASFLTAVDTKIEQLTSKTTLLQEYKKGVMQKIFSQEIRFHPKGISSQAQGRDDDGSDYPEWVEKKLDSVSSITMGQSPDSNSYNNDKGGMYLIQGNADIIDRKTQPRQWTNKPTKICDVSDLILTVRAPVGAIAKSLHKACIGRGVCSIKNNELSNIEFLYQFLLSYEKKWIRLEQGSTFTAVSTKDIKALNINLPSLKEQTKIANFLSSIDSKIEQTQKQLNATKEFKKALLQQMFV